MAEVTDLSTFSGFVVLALLAAIPAFWFYVFLIRPLISNLRALFTYEQNRDSGRLIHGKIIRFQSLTEAAPGKQMPVAITVEFPNFAGSPIQEELQFIDTKPEQGRYREGNSLSLRAIPKKNGDFRIVPAEGSMSFNLRFWLIWLVGLALYGGGCYYLGSQVWFGASGDWNTLLDRAGKVDILGLLVGLGIGGAITFFSLRVFFRAFAKKGQSSLKWNGLRTTATIERLERTGVSVNDQPQVAFHYSFRGSDGRTHRGVDKKIVDLLEIGKLDEVKEKEILYLPADPSTSLFVENATSGGSGTVLLLKLVAYFVLLVFSIVVVAQILAQL
ncbi:MAG: hypothetical protein KDK23_08700 [Leptospiraceae bacterium]|nr:hypothetical protein [Leptospiraceae bacterium]